MAGSSSSINAASWKNLESPQDWNHDQFNNQKDVFYPPTETKHTTCFWVNVPRWSIVIICIHDLEGRCVPRATYLIAIRVKWLCLFRSVIWARVCACLRIPRGHRATSIKYHAKCQIQMIKDCWGQCRTWEENTRYIQNTFSSLI